MRATALASAALVLLLAGCGDDDPTSPNETRVEMRDNSFSPANVTINRGATVRWANVGNVQHNTRSTTQVWSSANINPGAAFSFTFPNAGTFPYECTLHAGMTGTIVVQ